jgi:hypothetical protein
MKDLPFPLIHPNSKINTYWIPFNLLMMIYTATIMPYRMAFEEISDESWVIVEFLIDAIFWLDLIINMLTTFVNKEGVLVKNR